MKSVIFLLSAVLSVGLIGCGKPEVEESVVNPTGTGVGPFDLALSTETTTLANNFSVDINDDEGAVEFYNAGTPEVQYLVLDSYTTTVSGCSSTAVRVIPIWYPSETSTNPQLLASGYMMTTTPSARSLLKIAFTGLSGCKHISFSMIVRRLPIGPLKSSIEAPLQGTWDYASGGHTITMFIGAARIGWLEGKGTSYTCDTQIYPSSSIEAGGGWLLSSGNTLACRYKFDPTNSSAMTLNCFGTHLHGCTVPKSLRFIRH